MKIKTSELIGVALDWAVGHAMQYVTHSTLGWTVTLPVPRTPPGATPPLPFPKNFSPSTRWAQGGPLVEREGIELLYWASRGNPDPWEAQYGAMTYPEGLAFKGAPYIDQGPGDAYGGPTPLIAAMRALVQRKLGDEVDVPDEFVEVKQ